MTTSADQNGARTSGPCSGIKVLEFCTMVSGPMCGQLLADFGADVIKLEGLSADPIRSVGPHYRGYSAHFSQFNRNKRSVVIDVRSERGRHVIRDLASQVDVFIENCRPGVAERLGLGYEHLRRNNDGLIYVSINGFGNDGPYRDYPAYDQVIQGLVGFMPVQGEESTPVPIKSVVVDKISALSAALASLAALQFRHANGGRGQRVEVKMLDAYAGFILADLMNNHTFQGPGTENIPPVDLSGIYGTIQTLDGHVVGLVFQDSQFHGICTALKREDIRSDSRFATPKDRVLHGIELAAALQESVRSFTTAQFLALARAHDVPFAPVNDIQGFFADPQVKHNKTYVDIEDPELGTLRQMRAIASFGATPAQLPHRAPKYGEHTQQILEEFGYDRDAIGRLKDEGLISAFEGAATPTLI